MPLGDPPQVAKCSAEPQALHPTALIPALRGRIRVTLARVVDQAGMLGAAALQM